MGFLQWYPKHSVDAVEMKCPLQAPYFMVTANLALCLSPLSFLSTTEKPALGCGQLDPHCSNLNWSSPHHLLTWVYVPVTQSNNFVNFFYHQPHLLTYVKQ